MNMVKDIERLENGLQSVQTARDFLESLDDPHWDEVLPAISKLDHAVSELQEFQEEMRSVLT